MLNDLTPEQRALAEYMSDLSEQAYSAGWMRDLEHTLWRALTDGPFRYGYLELTLQHIARLRELSERCGGWIRFDNDKEESFVSRERWSGGLYQRERAL
jgi:hypothetical protein